jgi:hypothetical protein
MEKVKFAEEFQTTATDLYAIVLYNDDVNTFLEFDTCAVVLDAKTSKLSWK